jgi:hypothetical protein
MASPVTLRDIIDTMDLPDREWQSYVNSETGAIVTVTRLSRKPITRRPICPPLSQRARRATLDASRVREHHHRRDRAPVPGLDLVNVLYVCSHAGETNW